MQNSLPVPSSWTVPTSSSKSVRASVLGLSRRSIFCYFFVHFFLLLCWGTLWPPSPHSRNSFRRSHFPINKHVHTASAPHPPPTPPLPTTHTLGPPLRGCLHTMRNKGNLQHRNSQLSQCPAPNRPCFPQRVLLAALETQWATDAAFISGVCSVGLLYGSVVIFWWLCLCRVLRNQGSDAPAAFVFFHLLWLCCFLNFSGLQCHTASTHAPRLTQFLSFRRCLCISLSSCIFTIFFLKF
jgi:hypothetical protein